MIQMAAHTAHWGDKKGWGGKGTRSLLGSNLLSYALEET